MNRDSYSYSHETAHRFVFKSVGRVTIIKVVDFTPTSIKDLYNVSFGDLLPDGSLDDMADSNNGDIVMVLSTVVQIIRGFTVLQPSAKLMFSGSTEGRMKLYARILKVYLYDFQKEFVITAFLLYGDFVEEVPFVPQDVNRYEAYFIKRIN